MPRRRRTHRYEDGVEVSVAHEEPALRTPRRWPTAFGIGFLAVVLAAGVAWLLYSWQKPRILRLRVFTDFAYRQKHPDWEQLVRDRIAGLNGIYDRTGIRWDIQSLDQADPTANIPDLDFRRRKLADLPAQPADLLLGISGQPGGTRTASIVPFTHSAMIVDAPGETEAGGLARELAHMFGAPRENAQPPGGQLSETAQKLIRRLRHYDFEHGTEELAGDGGDRAVNAMGEAYRNLAPDPLARAHEVAAASLIADHRIEAAIRHLRQAIKLDGKDASARLTLAAALSEEGDFNAAAAALREGVAADPDNLRLRAAAAALDAKTSHQPETVLALTEMVTRYPQDAELNAILGWLFLPEAGMIGQSATAFANARNADPDSPSALRGLERAASVKSQALSEVERRREGVRQHPEQPDAHFNLGVAHLMAGNFDAAQPEFERAVELNPNHGKAHVDLALIHWLKHDYPGAEREASLARKSGEEPSKELMRVIRKGLGQ